MSRAARALRAAFAADGRVDGVLLALVLFGAGLVAWNASVYPWPMSYDAEHHGRYVAALAQGRLPDFEDTREYFSPPLPYLVPAALVAAGASLDTAMRAGQLQNVGFWLGLSFVTLLLAEELRPGSRVVKRGALFFLATLPVLHRTFTFLRGEPLLALLSVLAVVLAHRQFASGPPPEARGHAVRLGLVLGLLLLTRQQGIFVIGAVTLMALGRAFAEPSTRRRRLFDLCVAGALTCVVAGGFYLSLWTRYGSPAAFNKRRAPFSLANRPAFFYFGTGDGLLFRDPLRPSFKGQLLPTLYADAWGDYYGYFLVYAWDARRDCLLHPADFEEFLVEKRSKGWLVTNRYERAAALARANLLSLLPTFFLTLGLLAALARLPALWSPEPDRASLLRLLLGLAVVISLVGYVALLLTIRHALGTTIKATYVLPVFPFLAVLAADLLERWSKVRKGGFVAAAVGLLAVALHNAPLLMNALAGAPGGRHEPCPLAIFE